MNANQSQAANAATEVPYHFRLRGKIQYTRNLTDFRRDSLVSHFDARRMEVCRAGDTQWIPLDTLLDFSGQGWRVLTPAQSAAPATPAAPDRKEEGEAARLGLTLLSCLGVVLIMWAFGLETGVDVPGSSAKVYNVSRGQSQSMLLILGVGLSGIGIISLTLLRRPNRSNQPRQ